VSDLGDLSLLHKMKLQVCPAPSQGSFDQGFGPLNFFDVHFALLVKKVGHP